MIGLPHKQGSREWVDNNNNNIDNNTYGMNLDERLAMGYKNPGLLGISQQSTYRFHLKQETVKDLAVL